MIIRCSLVLLWSVVLALGTAGTLCAERIRIAYSAISGVQMPLWVAQDKGLFKRQGLGGGTDYVVGLLLKKWGFQRGRDVKVFQTGGMPQLLSAVKTGIVDAGIISPPSNLQGLKIGLKEMVDVSDLGIPFANSPLNTTRSYISSHRDVVLRALRAYCEAIQQIRLDKESALKILAKYARVEDAEILQEVYRIYGSKHLEKVPYVRLEGVEEILRTLGKEAGSAKAADFVDNNLLRELDQEGLFRRLFPELKQ